MESDTPMTDAENYIYDIGLVRWVSIDFARELERELAAAKAELAAERATTAPLLRIIALIREAGGFKRDGLAALPDAVKAMRQQRDEARRRVCELSLIKNLVYRKLDGVDGRFIECKTPEEIAQVYDWDCFKDGGGA